MAALDEKREERCVMVGLQMDANGKELLHWAINRIAERGDRIVAVTVCRDSGQFLAFNSGNSLFAEDGEFYETSFILVTYLYNMPVSHEFTLAFVSSVIFFINFFFFSL